MDPSELLSYLAEGLVDDPEQVEVERFEEHDGTVILELAVGPDDYGKVIGRGGRTAAALRTVVGAAAAGDGQRVVDRHRRLRTAYKMTGTPRFGPDGGVGSPSRHLPGDSATWFGTVRRPPCRRPPGCTLILKDVLSS